MSRNKNARHSKESLYPLFDLYAKSKESRDSFCSRHGLGLHNYNYWWAKYRGEKGLHGLGKNRGHSKKDKVSQELVNIPNSVPATATNQTGTFIKMEGFSSVAQSGLILRTQQGIELRFEYLPPASYLQELLNLCPNN